MTIRLPALPAEHVRASYQRVVGLHVVSHPRPGLYMLDFVGTHMDSGPRPENSEPIYSMREVKRG